MDNTKYSMYKLFNLFNQNYLYKIYQPNNMYELDIEKVVEEI